MGNVNLNKVNLIGNLTADPQMITLPNGTRMTRFNVALNRRYKTRDGNTKDSVTFVRVVTYGTNAENCKTYLTKGRKVYISGRLENNSWVDKETKQRRSILQIVGENVQFLGAPPR